jgi:hypothetical protein
VQYAAGCEGQFVAVPPIDPPARRVRLPAALSVTGASTAACSSRSAVFCAVSAASLSVSASSAPGHAAKRAACAARLRVKLRIERVEEFLLQTVFPCDGVRKLLVKLVKQLGTLFIRQRGIGTCCGNRG